MTCYFGADAHDCSSGNAFGGCVHFCNERKTSFRERRRCGCTVSRHCTSVLEKGMRPNSYFCISLLFRKLIYAIHALIHKDTNHCFRFSMTSMFPAVDHFPRMSLFIEVFNTVTSLLCFTNQKLSGLFLAEDSRVHRSICILHRLEIELHSRNIVLIENIRPMVVGASLESQRWLSRVGSALKEWHQRA
jgi:hypothetical protein